MLMPKIFDQNEIFITVIGFFMIILFLGTPKRFTNTETLYICLFNFYLAAITDHIIAGPPLDNYNIMDNPKFEGMDLFIYLFLYAPSGYFLMYVYDLMKISKWRNLLFILSASVLSTFLEWLASKFNVFHYLDWNLFNSFLMYIFLFTLNIVYFAWMKNSIRLNKQVASNMKKESPYAK